LRHEAATTASACRRLALLQDEGRRHAFGFDARCRILRLTRLDDDFADVDDSWELADAIEEQPEIVIRAFSANLERKRGVERLLPRILRCEALNIEAGLRSQTLDAAEYVRHVLLLRQYGAEILEAPFEFRHFRLELGQASRGRHALRDVGPERRQPRLTCVNVGLHF